MSVTLAFLHAQVRHDRALIDLLETALAEIAQAETISLDDARAMAQIGVRKVAEFRERNSLVAVRQSSLPCDGERIWGGA